MRMDYFLKSSLILGALLLHACRATNEESAFMAHQFQQGSANAIGPCVVAGDSATLNGDYLFKVLTGPGACPKDVFDLRQKIVADGMILKPTMVGNRGFHNSAGGSFSFFEMVEGVSELTAFRVRPGDFIFGHFTGVDNQGQIGLNQEASSGNLMIELIVWDEAKGMFNFYEMIGAGDRGRWFYRGDSANIMADITLLHRQPNPAQPQFGRHLRCSGCHTNGGPIMKELSAPHNDWWRDSRRLPLGPNQPDAAVTGIMNNLVDADILAASVRSGMERLRASPNYNRVVQSLSLQERLRPLFCAVEINIASDQSPGDSNAVPVVVPAAFFLNSLLGTRSLTVDRSKYTTGLQTAGSRFPESGQLDADHAWLTPVKAESDTALIQDLVASGIVDNEFVADVLAVDMTHPVLSPKRCGLLKLLPVQFQVNWQSEFLSNLQATTSVSARELAQNLNASEHTVAFHQARAAAYLNACQEKLTQQESVSSLVRLLAQRRAEVFAAEISKNPLGQIFEPGFRVIFPRMLPAPVPQTLQLSEACVVQ